MNYAIQDIVRMSKKNTLSLFDESENKTLEVKRVEIYFKMNNFSYSLFIHSKGTVWYPATGILHDGYNLCPYCNLHSSFCDILTPIKKEIFDQIIKHPKVRLRKLFL